jgi:hypothetical protein
MARIMFFNFDGTDNEPVDAAQDKKLFGFVEDNSITNILKFHLLLGGSLKNENGDTKLENGSRSFYYHGIGTYGNFFERKYNAAFAPEGADVSTILRRARKDFRDHFNEGYDYIVLTGFSRGAALARRFAAIINDLLGSRRIIVEGVFDTVASMGIPNLNPHDRPSSDVVFEHGHTLPGNVLKALHLVSLDDKRKAFQPTLMNRDGRVTEIWFPGAHSDVGGGYNFDGLSDNAMRFFMDWFEDQPELDIRFRSSRNIDYDNIFKHGSKAVMGPDDVQVDPNPFGINHQQHERIPLLDRITLTDRRCCVIIDDHVAEDELPLVHWSVAERIRRDRDYRPASLKNIRHRICYQDMSEKIFYGCSDHKLKCKGNFRVPDHSGIVTRVYAHLKYNHTGIYLEKGKSYRIEVTGLPERKWRDGSIKPVDGKGWDRKSVELGLSEIAIAVSEPFRRVTEKGAKWFSLCGSIGDSDDNAFLIGNLLDGFVPEKSGELCAFANDLNGYYGNNSGYLEIRVSAR